MDGLNTWTRQVLLSRSTLCMTLHHSLPSHSRHDERKTHSWPLLTGWLASGRASRRRLVWHWTVTFSFSPPSLSLYLTNHPPPQPLQCLAAACTRRSPPDYQSDNLLAGGWCECETNSLIYWPISCVVNPSVKCSKLNDSFAVWKLINKFFSNKNNLYRDFMSQILFYCFRLIGIVGRLCQQRETDIYYKSTCHPLSPAFWWVSVQCILCR